MSNSSAIAIVGASCRLPGGINSLDDLWTALSEGRDAVTEAPPERFDAARFLDGGRRRRGRTYSVAGGFLGDIAGFDLGYFSGISPKEASRMDPQQRIMLEIAVETLDDAGADRDALAGSQGAVFVGCSSRDYGTLQVSRPGTGNGYTMTGVATGNIANRISHHLDWHGPSMSIDTACASALTAIHQACEHLRAGRSRFALAGGINIVLDPMMYVGFSDARMLSPTGRCRTFSAGADGFVRAEGGGLLMLKLLPDAIADNDRIHAVIVGSGTNSDGRTAALALPSADAQEALLRQTYTSFGVHPDRLAYLEAHGTGTAVGDPIECRAIGAALGAYRTRGPLPVGSVKSNMGHLESASGVPGILKAILTLRHATVPASLHATPLNDAIDFGALGIAPAVQATPIEVTPQSVVGVNSFGFGGANAHVILGPAPERSGTAAHSSAGLLPVTVSARTEEGLAKAAEELAACLESTAAADFYDVAYTSSVRRTRHEHRLVALATTAYEAASAMRGLVRSERPPAGAARARAAINGKVAFAFSGNGSQWPGMATDLLLKEPVFASAIANVDAVMHPMLGWQVAEELMTTTEARLRDTSIAQPLLFAVQVGLVELLASRGIRPAAVAGHSVGEIAAAYVSGAIDLATAARIVVARSRAQAVTAGAGRMAAMGMSASEAAPMLASAGLELAGVNSPGDITVAGDGAAIAAMNANMMAQGLYFRELELDYAFHSRAMDAIEPAFRDAIGRVAAERETIPFASAVTGTLANGSRLDADYWWRNIRQPVLFANAVEALRNDGCDVFVEIGPHAVLSPYLKRAAGPKTHMEVVRTCLRGGDGMAAVGTAVAQIIAAGGQYDRAAYFPLAGRVVSLPSYPWQREPHWNGSPQWWENVPGDGPSGHPLLGERAAVARPVWHTTLDARLPWLDDHKVGGTVVMPATGYLEGALAAGRRVLGSGALQISNLLVLSACTVPAAGDVLLQVAFTPSTGLTEIASRDADGGQWREHARGQVHRLYEPAPPDLDLAAITAAVGEHIFDAQEHYAGLARAGLPYGPAFRVLTQVRAGSGQVLAQYRFDGDTAGYEAHPAVLDGALQACAILLAEAAGGHLYLPAAIGRAQVWSPPANGGVVHLSLQSVNAHTAVVDLTVADTGGQVCARLTDCVLRRFDADSAIPVRYLETQLRARELYGAVPLSLPTPQQLIAVTADRQAEATAGYEEYAAAAKQLAGHFAARAFMELLPGRAEFGVPDLLDAGVLPQLSQLAELAAGLAVKAGLLEAAGNRRWRWAGNPHPSTVLTRLVDQYPQWTAVTLLVNRNGTSLCGILRGTTDAQELLTGEPDAHLLHHFHRDAPHMRQRNRFAASLIAGIVANWPAGRPLRILEIGAGIGATTAAVLPVLPRQATRYVFTDATERLFPRAKAAFAQYDFVEYQKLDVESDPLKQGLAPGSFDLVIAANAIRATSVPAMLERIAALLADGGMLMTVTDHDHELTGFLFGALESHWVGDGTPAHGALLDAASFDTVASSHDDGRTSDSSVILARRAPRQTPAGTEPAVPLPAAFVVSQTRHSALAASVAAQFGTVALPPETADLAALLPTDPATSTTIVLMCDSTYGDAIADAFDLIGKCVHALADKPGSTLCVVTGPTGLFPTEPGTPEPEAAAIWGIARAAANEYPQLKVKRISLEPGADPRAGALRIAQEATLDSNETEIVLTASGRFVTRLAEREPASATASNVDAYQLQVRDPGMSHRLAWVPKTLPDLEPGEVLVAVKAAALNYRDIMHVTGLLPDDSPDPDNAGPTTGFECAGEIIKAGPGVDGYAPGDRVFAVGKRCLASHNIMRADQVGRIPEAMSYRAAATLPTVFTTVQYGLETLAKLSAGETVLVHGGAGGVGLAAIQYAQQTGARVIATAGTPAKREFLRSLGVADVVDSRDPGFAQAVLAATGGAGVDVVLNSLAGEAIARGLECLRTGGRFVELGKRDIYANTPLLLGPFRKNISLHAVDISQIALHTPHVAAAEFAELTRRVHSGQYRPISYQSYPAARIGEAFQTLRHSKHVGKIVIDFAEPPTIEAQPESIQLDPQGTYLITGGLGGLGGQMALRLAHQGARHLVLVGRRGMSSPEAPAITNELASHQVTVSVHAADVADAQAMAQIIAGIDTSGHPLRGVIHAAMHIDDAPLTELTRQRVDATLHPKVGGLRVLEQLTRHHELGFFFVCSSVSATLGNIKQAAYCAANLYLEAAMTRRRREGLAGTAIAWGSIDDTGYVARQQLGEALSRQGLPGLSSGEVWKAFNELTSRGATSAIVGRFAWDRIGDLLAAIRTPMFGLLYRDRDTGADVMRPALRRRQLQAMKDPEAIDALARTLAELVAAVLQTSPQRVDRTCKWDQLGVDSLMVVELAAAVRRTFGCDLPVMDLMAASSLDDLARRTLPLFRGAK